MSKATQTRTATPRTPRLSDYVRKHAATEEENILGRIMRAAELEADELIVTGTVLGLRGDAGSLTHDAVERIAALVGGREFERRQSRLDRSTDEEAAVDIAANLANHIDAAFSLGIAVGARIGR